MLKRTFAAALVLLLAAVSAEAQYFGRNKVQYDRFDFAILQTPHFDIYYYDAEREAARLAARMAERWYERLSKALDHRFARRQPIILYASHAHFAQTTITNNVTEGIGGFMDHRVGRVVLPFAAGLGETDHVLGHELVHAFQRDILRRRGRSSAMLPLWFIEGMAEHLSVGRVDAATAMWLRDAAEGGDLPTIEDLDDPRWFPYRFGQALWSYIADRYGAAAIVRALKSRASGGAAGRLRDATGDAPDVITRGWHEVVKRLATTKRSAESGHAAARLIDARQHGGRMNVGPALSPDGRFLVFLSERDGFSVDVFLADATTGEVIRKLMSTAADPHFDSLQFLDSAGSWDPGGERFALATVRDGNPVLTIFTMPDGDVVYEVPVPSLDQMFSPTWSPDGSVIAFSAMKGGVTDLYALDLRDVSIRALTGDPYSDLHPAWSPDGSRIAFATDRFSSTLDALIFGPHQLAMLDVKSGAIASVAGAPGGKNIDPQWSQDGRSLYFVSDASGASNVHRLDLETGVLTQITDVFTGVTGITALSPAISMAAGGSRVAMSVYSRSGYEIRTVSLAPAFEPDAGDDEILAARAAAPFAAALVSPPAAATPDEAFTARPYVPRLSLAAIGQPYMTAGGGAFGTFLRAGASFAFGDMLGQQQLTTAIRVGKRITDFALQTSYLNRRSRWNWGILAGQVPSVAGVSERIEPGVSATGRPVLLKDIVVLQQIHRQIAGVASYPFNRAQRLEVSAGIDAIGFHRETSTSTYSAATGNLLDRATTRAAGTPATLFETGAALVYDTAIVGPTSPLVGQRYRFALAPSVGDLTVLTTIADYRRYLMPVRPFTIALRLHHVARSGADSSDPRLLPLVWTLRDVVRGHDSGRDLLRTSRFLAANAELRFPLPGVFRRDLRYGSLPLEGLVFSDWGRFTIRDAEADAGQRIRALWSAGAGMRLNAAGFVIEVAAAKRLAPAGSWRLALNFRPGF